MKIYRKIRIRMDTGEVLEEDSFEYTGPLALCWEADTAADDEAMDHAGLDAADRASLNDMGLGDDDVFGYDGWQDDEGRSGTGSFGVSATANQDFIDQINRAINSKGLSLDPKGQVALGQVLSFAAAIAKKANTPTGKAVTAVFSAVLSTINPVLGAAGKIVGFGLGKQGQLAQNLADVTNLSYEQAFAVLNASLSATNSSPGSGSEGSRNEETDITFTGDGDTTDTKDAGGGSAASQTAGSYWSAYHPGRTAPAEFGRDQTRAAIANAYRQSLGRDPAAEEITGWENAVNSGQQTLDMVVKAIAGSEEAKGFTGQPLPPQGMPTGMIPGQTNALRPSDAQISNLISGAVDVPAGRTNALTEQTAWPPGNPATNVVNNLASSMGGTNGNASPNSTARTIQVNSPGGGFEVQNGVVVRSSNPQQPVGSQWGGRLLEDDRSTGSGGQNVETYTTPGSNYGTLEDMYRANLPNLQNALRTGRADYEEGYERSTAAYEEAYNRAIVHLEEGYQRGRTDVENMLNETREILAPYGKAGDEALGRLSQAMSGNFESFRQSPDYQFRLNEGAKLVERQASLRGELGAGDAGGRFAKEMTRFGQDLASTEYGNWFNRNKQLADTGLAARELLTNALTTSGNTLAVLAGNTAQGKAGAAQTTGAGKATAAQWAGSGKATLTRDVADMTTKYGIAARSGDISNSLAREALGVDWAKINLSESEAAKDRQFTEKMAERGYDVYNKAAKDNRKADYISTGLDLGKWYLQTAGSQGWWPFN